MGEEEEEKEKEEDNEEKETETKKEKMRTVMMEVKKVQIPMKVTKEITLMTRVKKIPK